MSDYEQLDAIRETLHTQDNRGSSDPIWHVQERKRDYGIATSHTDIFVWIAPDGEEACGAEHEELERAHEEGKDNDPWERIGVVYRWEHVETFFTESAANVFMEAQRHNYGPLRTYCCQCISQSRVEAYSATSDGSVSPLNA